MVRPSQRREMARSAVDGGRTSIRHACQTFDLSEACYRYQAKRSDENAVIADWLERLTTAYRTWGFGLCFLYLRNVKRQGWNHKRVYRIYRELELNLRIKVRKARRAESAKRLPPIGYAGVRHWKVISIVIAMRNGGIRFVGSALRGCSTDCVERVHVDMHDFAGKCRHQRKSSCREVWR